MARRVHPNMNGEFGNSEFNSGTSEGNNFYNNYGNDYQSQDNYNYQTMYDYGTSQNDAYASGNPQSESYLNSSTNYYGDNTNINSYTSVDHQYGNYNQNSKVPANTSFPKVHTSPIINQPVNMGYGSQPSYTASSDRSWISAFSSGGFDNEPPLLEGTTIFYFA